MIKKITCIECPLGCGLSVDIENHKAVKVRGNKCPKGEIYAASEIENPMRILTSTVIAEGLGLNAVPVRTDRPIPKAAIPKAMAEIRKIRLRSHISIGDVIAGDLAGSGANLIASRDCL